MTMSQSEPVTIRPQAVAPSWKWALRRAAFGLVLMVAMTTFAAYLANASIELSADPVPASIAIGTPAAALLGR
jgi:hypothetical protein